MLKRSILVLAAVLAAATLSACGVVAAFIPDQEVANPLGINGATMDATLQDTEPEPGVVPGDSASQQSELVKAADGPSYAMFYFIKEIDNAEDTLPLNPAAMEQPIGFARFIVTKATDDGLAFPDTVSFQGDMGFAFWDDFVVAVNNLGEAMANRAAINNSFDNARNIEKIVYSDQTVSFAKNSENCTTRRCVYLPTEATIATLNLNGGDVRNIVEITKPGTASNSVAVYLNGSFVSDPPLPSGGSVEMIISADKATVKF